LVVEDQVMDDIVTLLEDEFEIVRADSYKRWRELRDGGELASVDAALVDRHLDVSRPDDSLGTTKVAAYLQRYTDIPVTLMSVDVDCSANKQLELCRKYRLMDVIRKHHDGTLNTDGLIAAARDMTDRSPKGRRRQLERWVESIAYQVEDENLFGGGRGRDRMTRCENERNAILRLLAGGDLEQAETKVARFMAEYGQPGAASRP
jgi:hypothetical protein